MKPIHYLICAWSLFAGACYAQSIQTPMLAEYPMLCPSCSEARSISVRYAIDGTSILQTHPRADVPQIAPAHDDSIYLPGEWIAGPMTRFKPGLIQRWDDEIGTNFIEVQNRPALEEGVRYVDRRLTRAADRAGQNSWSIQNIRVSVQDGEDDRTIQGLEAEHRTATVAYRRTEFDADGQETGTEEIAYTFDLWSADELPFSPLLFQYEPFLGNHVPPFNGGPIGTRLIAELIPLLEPFGGLVRAEVSDQGSTYAIELRAVRTTPEPPMHKFTSLPVVSGEQVGQFAGPLFLASLLRDGMIRAESNANLKLNGRELAAVCAWKTNEAGDLAIVVSARDENTSLFLVRPVNGVPEPGTYGTTLKPAYSRLRAMNEDERATHTDKFQLYGIATDTTLPTVLTGLEEGTVHIHDTEDEVIAGTLRGMASALPTDTLADVRPMAVELTFRAKPGLEGFTFRSDESRLAR